MESSVQSCCWWWVFLSTTMANPRLRALTWWRKWAKKDWAIAAVGFTVVVFLFTLVSNSWRDDDSNGDQPFDHGHVITDDLVDLTLLHNANDRGALCLDGSFPGYHFQNGFGSGSNNWLLHIEGGGWCNTTASCSLRKFTRLGSSKYMERQVRFSGILSPDPSKSGLLWLEQSQDTLLRWCVFCRPPRKRVENKCNRRKMEQHFSSEGSSSGNHLWMNSYHLACLVRNRLFFRDALLEGWLLLYIVMTFENFCQRMQLSSVLLTQGVAKSLHKDCVSRMEPSECLFPRELVKNIRTPVFLVNSAYDFWQIQHILIPDGSDPHRSWQNCRLNIHDCNPSQIEILQGFRGSLLTALSEFQKNKEGGMFENACFVHCQTWMAHTWHSPKSPRINNKAIAESIGDWFFNRNILKQIDCPYPCNPTCYHMDLTRGRWSSTLLQTPDLKVLKAPRWNCFFFFPKA